MINFMTILEKLKDILSKDIIDDKKIFDKDVASALGINSQAFATMKKRAKVPYDEILQYCALKKISINWLLFDQDPSSLIDNTDKYWIRYYSNVSASAGGGAFNDDMEFANFELQDYMIAQLGGERNIRNIEAINVTGDSMEPTLCDTNIIFVDRTKNTLTKDGIYAINYDDGFLVKRLIKKNRTSLYISSDNELYPTMSANYDEIEIVGKVIGSFGSVY
jgi:phage repressor protein C with HTH and peptisase S24 domain